LVALFGQGLGADGFAVEAGGELAAAWLLDGYWSSAGSPMSEKVLGPLVKVSSILTVEQRPTHP
jgi:hypothetical protein